MRVASKIVLASTNLHKLQELRQLIEIESELELVGPQAFIRNSDKIGLVETHSDYLGNAIAKARLVNQGCHYPSLGDDSGLEVLALEGKPGVYSARFAKLSGYPSQQDQDRANIELLLSKLVGASNRRARFVCTLALVIEGLCVTAEGVLEGRITENARGGAGFGYDPIFIPEGMNKTLAELTMEEKNRISHRALAVQNLFKKLRAHGIDFARP